MPITEECPVCSGQGMIGTTSCGKCRGTGKVRLIEEEARLEAKRAEARAADQTATDESEETVDLGALVNPRKVKVKLNSLKLAGAPKRAVRGLSFKN